MVGLPGTLLTMKGRCSYRPAMASSWASCVRCWWQPSTPFNHTMRLLAPRHLVNMQFCAPNRAIARFAQPLPLVQAPAALGTAASAHGHPHGVQLGHPPQKWNPVFDGYYFSSCASQHRIQNTSCILQQLYLCFGSSMNLDIVLYTSLTYQAMKSMKVKMATKEAQTVGLRPPDDVRSKNPLEDVHIIRDNVDCCSLTVALTDTVESFLSWI